MRLSAYKKLIDSAFMLPEKLDGEEYFQSPVRVEHSPRAMAIAYVLETARKDTQGLFNGELVTLLTYSGEQGERMSST